MANFNTNFSKLRLLSTQKISGWIDETEFEIVPPKLLDYYNSSFTVLLSLLEKDIDEIKNMIIGQEFSSHYLLFSFILAGADKSEDVLKLALLILSGLQLIVPDLEFKNKKFVIREKFLTEDAFSQIIIILFQMLKKEKIIINSNDDEFTKREKEMKKKVQRIKRNARKDTDDSASIDNMLASILYEFQQYNLEDLFELNIYTIYYLFGYVGKISNYEVNKISFATGNFKKGKKLKYFIEK